jgi:SulP family sulfate permease
MIDGAALSTDKTEKQMGDVWGGLAAMLVALPSAIAFGVIIFSPLGIAYLVFGAVAGILGTAALGLVASSFGGTNRLITAPCAPAAAVLSALTLQLTQKNVQPEVVLLMLVVVALLCGGLQILFGVIGLGRLIKYMPFPVVSGYLSGVGLIIILSQTPKFLGVPGDKHFIEAISSPHLWKWQGITVGAVTIGVMLLAPKITNTVPAAIAALMSGVLAYFGLAFLDRTLLELVNNTIVIGPMNVSGAAMAEAVVGRWRAMGSLQLSQLSLLIFPALTLAVLLSIDTLKTCVVLDAVTRSRHSSNRELIGQGLGNLASAAVGGIPGAGTMGATLVNISSGARTRRSGIIEGALALVAFLLLGKVIAWVPIAALAGILIVVGVRMFDRQSLRLLKSRSTILDFLVIVAVVIVAESVSLIAASGVGIALAVMLFIREQIGGSVIRRKLYGNQIFSHRVRLSAERAILEEHGARTVIFELQGSLFFGTADQMYSRIEPELKNADTVILDMRRVQSMDVSAAHMLEILQDTLTEQGRTLIFSHLPSKAPSGQDMHQLFDQAGLVKPERPVTTFDHLHDALEWAEDRILAEHHIQHADQQPLELREIDLFRGLKAETLVELEACMRKQSFTTGEMVFNRGDDGDNLFLIRRGSVRIMLPMCRRSEHHVATFSRGDFFGEVSFLDGGKRSADAMAFTDTEVFVFSRQRFDDLSEAHKRTAIKLLEGIATSLALRLRNSNAELLALKEE